MTCQVDVTVCQDSLERLFMKGVTLTFHAGGLFTHNQGWRQMYLYQIFVYKYTIFVCVCLITVEIEYLL